MQDQNPPMRADARDPLTPADPPPLLPGDAIEFTIDEVRPPRMHEAYIDGSGNVAVARLDLTCPRAILSGALELRVTRRDPNR